MNLKTIGYRLGFTREVREELSDLISTPAVVKEKKYYPEDGSFIFLGISTCLYSVTFTTEADKDVTFYESSLYHHFEAGDLVKINYMEKFLTAYDYVPPDFKNKQRVERVMSGLHLVSAYNDSVCFTSKKPDVHLVALDADQIHL